MDKNDPPESFGVFKPVGHIVIAYRSAADLQAAAQTLAAQGFVSTDLVRYTPEEMMAQVDAQLPEASPLASLGQDLNLIKAHRDLAEGGCSFLVVKAPQDEQADAWPPSHGSTMAVAAQRYGRFIVEKIDCACRAGAGVRVARARPRPAGGGRRTTLRTLAPCAGRGDSSAAFPGRGSQT